VNIDSVQYLNLHLVQREKKCLTALIAYQELVTVNVDT
jgi:hypothetical protein